MELRIFRIYNPQHISEESFPRLKSTRKSILKSLEFLEEHFGNPSSSHQLGERPRAAIARARSQLAGMLSANDDEIIFTSGGSEANNMALKGVMQQHEPSSSHLVISAFEHPAILEPRFSLCQFMNL